MTSNGQHARAGAMTLHAVRAVADGCSKCCCSRSALLDVWHVTDDDARAAYTRFLANLTNADKSVDLELASFPVAQRALAQQVVAQARAGRNLCVLAQCYSRGLQPMHNIIPSARMALVSMNDGDVSEPIDIGTTVVIVMRLKRRAVPSFDDVREEMRARATEDAIQRERSAWLQELRTATHVESKL